MAAILWQRVVDHTGSLSWRLQLVGWAMPLLASGGAWFAQGRPKTLERQESNISKGSKDRLEALDVKDDRPGFTREHCQMVANPGTGRPVEFTGQSANSRCTFESDRDTERDL